jgi:hypothetical protein
MGTITINLHTDIDIYFSYSGTPGFSRGLNTVSNKYASSPFIAASSVVWNLIGCLAKGVLPLSDQVDQSLPADLRLGRVDLDPK